MVIPIFSLPSYPKTPRISHDRLYYLFSFLTIFLAFELVQFYSLHYVDAMVCTAKLYRPTNFASFNSRPLGPPLSVSAFSVGQIRR